MASKDDVGGAGAGGSRANVSNFSLQFVNISMDTVSKEEKKRNQKVVRSAAMKSFRQKQKAQRLHDKAGKKSSERQPHVEGRGIGEADVDDGETHLEALGTSPVSSEPSGSSSDGSYSESLFESRRSSPALTSSEVAGIEALLHVGNFGGRTQQQPFPSYTSGSSSSISRLGGGRVDPFQMYASGVAGTNVSELIDHSLSILWPGFRPRSSPTGGSTLAMAWHNKVRERPIVMHAMLFGASVHMEVLRSPRMSIHNPVRLYHKVQTMRLLKEELKSPDKLPLDDVILAVLCLGTNEIETMMNHLKEKIYSPFNSPLASIQWLDVYGSIAHIAEHTVAMRSLVTRRGGLEHIELDGLAEVILFSDILGATQKVTKPFWPLLRRTLNYTTTTTPQTPPIARHQLRNLGRGFLPLLSFGVTIESQQVFESMAELTIIIDGHSRGCGPVWDFANLIDRRNAIQHQLMSLPEGAQLSHGEVSSIPLYEAIRYAAIIYSVAVTFPLPPLTGIFLRLSTLLHTHILSTQNSPCWQLCPKALLWILTLGAITASGTPDRSWYITNLSAVARSLGLFNWEDVVSELGMFLWLESACDVAGRKVWDEVTCEGVAVGEGLDGLYMT